jgi:hypothetical protein
MALNKNLTEPLLDWKFITESGANKKLHTTNEAAFDDITEEPSYWLGFLEVDVAFLKKRQEMH